jgi:hypothetical protein
MGDQDMAFKISRADYFYCTVSDEPGEGYRLLSQLAEQGVNLLAFTAVPVGPAQTQFSIFPEDPRAAAAAAQSAGIKLDGPHSALLVQGDDELGAFADIHEKLAAADVNVFASSGVTDGKGSFGYVLYIRPAAYERAATALGI